MVGPRMEKSSRDSSHASLCFTGGGVPLVVTGCGGDDLVTTLVDGPGGGGCQLSVGQMCCGSVKVVFSGFRMILAQ